MKRALATALVVLTVSTPARAADDVAKILWRGFGDGRAYTHQIVLVDVSVSVEVTVVEALGRRSVDLLAAFLGVAVNGIVVPRPGADRLDPVRANMFASMIGSTLMMLADAAMARSVTR